MKAGKIIVGLLKGILIAVVAVIVIISATVGTAVWILTPERLTPLVERYAPEYLDADISVKRVELTYWSSFPKLNVEIDSLVIISRSLSSLSAAQLDSLPADASRLLAVDGLKGSVDIPGLIKGSIRLYDVTIDKPDINLVVYDQEHANYMIVLPSEEKEVNSDLPELGIDKFLINGPAPMRYFSLKDSIDVRVGLISTMLDGGAEPRYMLDLSGISSGQIGNISIVNMLPFGLNGAFEWSPAVPDRVSIHDMDVSVGEVTARINTSVQFADSMRIEGLDMRLTSIALTDILALGDSVLGASSMPMISSDLRLSCAVRFDSAYTVGGTRMPDIHVDVDIPEGTFVYDRLKLNGFALELAADLPSADINFMRLDIKRLKAVSNATGFGISGTVTATGNITDPLFEGKFKGGINFGRLPAALASRIPVDLSGLLIGDTKFRFRPSQLASVSLDNVRLDGRITLDNFDIAMRDSSAYGSVGKAVLDFAANTVLHRSGMAIDSMTTVSINIDTLAACGGGVRFNGKDLHAGVGARGVGGYADTTRLIPVGINLHGGRASLRNDSDSTRIFLRDFDTRATLSRYKGAVNRPRFDLNVSSKRIMYADRLNRAVLTDASVNLLLHPRPRPRLGKSALAIYDSISMARPDLRLDSIYALTVAEQRRRRRDSLRQNADSVRTRRTVNTVDSTSMIDFGVDNSIRKWLRLWDASGTVKAVRARAFTPYFPVRNRLDSVDISFNTDSLIISDTRYRSGNTSVVMNGTISNISRAVSSRRGEPIDIKIDLDFDTLDINTFAAAAFAGSSFASRQDTVHIAVSETDSDAAMQEAIEKAAGGDTLAFVVPSNVRADLRLRAREVLYADIWFQRVTGRVEIGNSAIHLDRLGGFTPIGSMDLTALYSAPDIRHVDFAAGMVIRKLDLHKFLHLIPQVDSLLPLLEHIEGIITADIAMSTQLDSLMDIKFHTLQAAMKLEGDSLVVLDNNTFRKLSKWLIFKNKERNMIDHMGVELFVRDSKIEFLPFQFDIDRYRLGVWGGNTLDMRYDYHVAVLKSPLPFKFGINISGHDDDFRIRLGKANFNPNEIVNKRQLTDTTRINLVNEIRNVFRFGVRSGDADAQLELSGVTASSSGSEYNVGDTLTHADSVLFMQEGVIEMTPAVADSLSRAEAALKKWEEEHQPQVKKKSDKKDNKQSSATPQETAIKRENE